MKQATWISALVLSCFLVGCDRHPAPIAPDPPRAADAKKDRRQVREQLDNIESFLADLEGRLRLSNEDSWRHEFSSALHALGNIRAEVVRLKQESVNVGSLESLLCDLESRLKVAGDDTWSVNASTARDIAGSIRIELQGLRRGL